MLLKQSLPWNSPETENWERHRSLQLPWVKDLNTEEIIELRQEATSALGRLRSLLSTRLVDGELDGVRIANELAGEAKEIEAELEAWKRAKGKRFAIGYGALGIGLVIYGVAHDTILAAGSALLSGIGKVYGELRTEKIETAKLRSSPGFVLLKAHQLLKHRAH